MKIILTFTLMMIPGVVSSISVTGYSGGGVTITCKYDEEYTENKKYFCKSKQWKKTCSDLIKTDIKDKWVRSGRFSLYDDTRSTVFIVTIRNLTELDSDTYWCGTDISLFGDFYTEVNLKVITETTSSSSTTTTSSPSSPSTSTSSSPSTKTTSSALSSSSTTTASSSPSTITTSSSSSSPSSTSTSSSSSPSTTTASSSSASNFSDKTSLFTGSSLITSLVLVLLVLIVVGLLLLYIFNKRQSQGGGLSSQTGPEKHEVVSHTGCDYEEIKDTHIQLPTNPSDSSDFLYSTAQLPTNPSDSSDTVYATVELPTSPSVSSNCIYATVEKATVDSVLHHIF